MIYPGFYLKQKIQTYENSWLQLWKEKYFYRLNRHFRFPFYIFPNKNTALSITSCCHWALGVSGLFPAGSCVPHEPHTAHSLQCHRPLGTRRSPTQYMWYLNQSTLLICLIWDLRFSWWWLFRWSFGIWYHITFNHLKMDAACHSKISYQTTSCDG